MLLNLNYLRLFTRATTSVFPLSSMGIEPTQKPAEAFAMSLVVNPQIVDLCYLALLRKSYASEGRLMNARSLLQKVRNVFIGMPPIT